MSFSAEWLALREPVDHASRNAAVGAALGAAFAGRSTVRVLDLGCGTGSNLRATAPLLGQRQEWLLADHDPALLVAARETLAGWADRARDADGRIDLVKDGRDITVTFYKADLTRDLAKLLAMKPELVTASALFDLISPDWIERFAGEVKAAGAAFFTVLTYDGRDSFAPAHPLDAEVIAAFAAHQHGDKGFGPAAGPRGAATLAHAFRSAGFTVQEGDSPWRIGPDHAALAGDLVRGIAGAVTETGKVGASGLHGWLAFRLRHLTQADALIVTGHTDTLALPG
jgi:SAM-dependent methyltransferase